MNSKAVLSEKHFDKIREKGLFGRRSLEEIVKELYCYSSQDVILLINIINNKFIVVNNILLIILMVISLQN